MLTTYVSPYVDEDDRGLDEVGPLAVLGAMVEQRKRSSSIPPPPTVDEEDRADARDAARSNPGPLHPNDVFQKIR